MKVLKIIYRIFYILATVSILLAGGIFLTYYLISLATPNIEGVVAIFLAVTLPFIALGVAGGCLLVAIIIHLIYKFQLKRSN